MILVTGGAGFIGSHIVDAFLERGDRVVVVDDLSGGKAENINPRATFYQLSLEDPELGEIFAREGVEWVNHHAAQIDVRLSVSDPVRDARINIQGLLHLLEHARHSGVKGVIFASSGGVVYGEPRQLPVREDHPKSPLSPYGVSKLSGEYYFYCYHRVHGLPYIALRYGNVYGPRQDPHGEAGVIAIFAEQMLSGETPIIYGDGEQLRDFVYVEDVVQANLHAFEHLQDGLPPPGSLDDHAYNIATGQGTSVNEIFHHLREITGFEGEAVYRAERPGELRAISLDSAKAERDLGWKPITSLPEGLRKTVEYFSAER